MFETGLEFLLEDGLDPVTSDDLRVLDDLLTQHANRVTTWDEHYTLYELTK